MDVKKSKGKGKNFSIAEETQLCRTFLKISQEPIVGTGQKSKCFWERVGIHYNSHLPSGCSCRPNRSLECKWSDIKTDVLRFSGAFAEVQAMKQSGAGEDDVMRKAFELYKVRHPKNLDFRFIHCWDILKVVPEWFSFKPDDRTQSMKRKTFEEETVRALSPSPQKVNDHYSDGCPDSEEKVEHLPVRPQGRKFTIQEPKFQAITNSARRPQAKAIADLVATNREKANVLQDQAALVLFSIDESLVECDMFNEYLRLRKQEELENVKRRLSLGNNVTCKPRTTCQPSKFETEHFSPDMSYHPQQDEEAQHDEHVIVCQEDEDVANVGQYQPVIGISSMED